MSEKVAARLGYQCLSREVILDASELYHIPEIKLVKAIHDAPSILERFGHSQSRFVAYYQSALARNVQKQALALDDHAPMSFTMVLPEISCSKGFPTYLKFGSSLTWATGYLARWNVKECRNRRLKH